MKKYRVAAIQMTSDCDKEKNLKQAEKLITKAVRSSAKLIVLPEVFNFRGKLSEAANAAESIPGYSTKFISFLAKKYKVWILIGSLMEDVKAGFPPEASPPSAEKPASVLPKIKNFTWQIKEISLIESTLNSSGPTYEKRLSRILG